MKKLLSISLTLAIFNMASAEEIMVSAAASLTNAFNDIAKNYEAKYPEDKVLLNYGASGALLAQMEQGAPVDIFASADQATMDKAIDKSLIQPETRKAFVKNTLVVITPNDSTITITDLADLKKPEIKKIAVANPASVPVGSYTKKVLEGEQLWEVLSPKFIDTENVRQSLAYVAQGEVDSGFVYGTDAAVMKDNVKVQLTVPTKQPIEYPIALTKSAKKGSERFIEFIFTPESQTILENYGFSKP